MEKESLLNKIIFWFKNNKFFSIIIFLAIVTIAAANVFNSITSIVENRNKLISHTTDTVSVPKVTNEFAIPTLKFGSGGTGPGFFRNAWLIAVNNKGKIYVGERENGGRIQVFDSVGGFITQWNNYDKTSLLLGIAVDRQGIVYTASDPSYRYNGETGKLLGQMKFDGYPSDIKTNLNGGLIMSIDQDIILSDSKGNRIKTIHDAILSHPDVDNPDDDASRCDHIAVNGLGTFYVIEHYAHAVFRFSSGGKFLNRFGGSDINNPDGDAPGRFHMGVAITVDGQGRIYLSDMNKGILVFNSDGSYITTFNTDNVDGVAFGMIFNDKNELFVAADDHIVKYILNDNFNDTK